MNWLFSFSCLQSAKFKNLKSYLVPKYASYPYCATAQEFLKKNSNESRLTICSFQFTQKLLDIKQCYTGLSKNLFAE